MTAQEQAAVILATEPRGETDLRVLLLTAAGDLLDAHAPAARRSRKRFGAALQAATRVSVRWERRRESGLAVLLEATPQVAPPATDPLERFYVTSHLLELARMFAREGAEDPALYRLVVTLLDRLSGECALEGMARYAEAWMLRLAGLLPELNLCAQCGRSLDRGSIALVAERGAFCAADAPPGAWTLSRAAADWLSASRSAPPEKLPPPGRAAGAELGRVLQALIEDFTGQELKAIRGLARIRRNK